MTWNSKIGVRVRLSDRVEIFAGRVRVAGTWFPVSTIVELLEHGYTPETLWRAFREDISLDDIVAACEWGRKHPQMVRMERELFIDSGTEDVAVDDHQEAGGILSQRLP